MSSGLGLLPCDNRAERHLAKHLKRIMPDLPSDSVTFLCTGIEGSTERWKRDRVACEWQAHLANTVCYGRRQVWVKEGVARRALQDLPSTELESH